MTQTEGKKDSDLIQRTSPKKLKYWTWAIGGPVGLILIGMWSRLQYYAAHVLLIPQFTISIIYLIYSTVDAFNDPAIGYIADHSTRFTEKYGKRFPWIITGRIIQPIFLILCFIPISTLVNDPGNLMLSIVWFTLMMCIYETMATVTEINEAALFPDLFRSQDERTKSIRASQIVTFIYQVVIVSLIIPMIIGRLGGKDSYNAYIGTVIITAVMAYIMLIPFSYGAYENKEMRAFRVQLDQNKKSSSPFKEIIIRIFKDKNWMAYVILFTLFSIAGRCFLAGIEFFFYDGLGYEIDSFEAILPRIIVLIMTFIGSLLFIPLIKKYGARKCAIVSLTLFSLSFLLFFLTPLALFNYICIFAGLAYGGVTVSGIYIGAESIDNAVIQSGKREEGSYSGVLRVFTAYSYALQTFIFSIVSFFTGFVSGDPSTYTDAAYIGLLIQISVIPSILILIAAIAFALLYSITKEDALQNSEKLKQLGL